MLELQNVTKVFNPGTVNEKIAVNDVSLKLEDGDFVTVIGSNGAGKSTMLNLVAGLWKPDSGNILLDDINVTKMPEFKRAKYMGRVFQDPRDGTASDMNIEDTLLNGESQKRKEKHIKNCSPDLDLV